MSFQKILLVALLAVSAVMGRSLVSLNAGEGKVLHGRSAPAFGDAHHGSLEKREPLPQHHHVSFEDPGKWHQDQP
ncbi:hypothetical protein MJO28_002336 [Puccinia striiformis f. sp. tritici]|nr:hypothetical protein Pst134EB_003584 [Puccinia striiformis f. sp. tritici]KAI9609884.1 hypothetical protein H4Q26_006873 [Puccinia striiformis f. sp. tritici PST-130]KNE93678.1 hypothetical protein PSTG_12959 [Puccinia striiformis f. sp. tritici PST-78]POW09718.1 hypothetical protein PSHT_09001 [Puccinia striiformis]KAI7961847.1 hypothetical protein MJO28_002336 [Puccinia striiformis f. sp. tritici]